MTHLWGTADTAPRRAAPTRSCPPHLMTSSGGLAAPWCQTTFWCNFFWRKKVWPVQDQFVAPEIFDIFFEFYFFGNLRKITFFFFDISNNSKYFCFQKWFYRFQWLYQVQRFYQFHLLCLLSMGYQYIFNRYDFTCKIFPNVKQFNAIIHNALLDFVRNRIRLLISGISFMIRIRLRSCDLINNTQLLRI